MLPFVTCLCLTRNRRNWLPQAIECFQKQTYPNRELLIVADGETVQNLVPVADNIRLLEVLGSLGIGDKRNFGCERALGEIIAHWDDDDVSAPSRLSDQVDRLMQSGKAVTGYHSMHFQETATGKWWKYEGHRGYALGTSLCYRKDWWRDNSFPSVQVGEDNHMTATAGQQGQLVTVDAGELMYATIHTGNSSPRKVLGDSWRSLSLAA